MKFLIVDDEVVSRKKMDKILSGFGECQSVANGKAATVAFTQSLKNKDTYDLVSLDVSMPDMDGTQVLAMMRKVEKDMGIEKANQAKILMVTAQSNMETVKTCIMSGCNDYVIKPFTKEMVAQKLKKFGMI